MDVMRECGVPMTVCGIMLELGMDDTPINRSNVNAKMHALKGWDIVHVVGVTSSGRKIYSIDDWDYEGAYIDAYHREGQTTNDEIMALLESEGPMKVNTIAYNLGLTRTIVRRRMRKLASEGRVESYGHPPEGKTWVPVLKEKTTE